MILPTECDPSSASTASLLPSYSREREAVHKRTAPHAHSCGRFRGVVVYPHTPACRVRVFFATKCWLNGTSQGRDGFGWLGRARTQKKIAHIDIHPYQRQHRTAYESVGTRTHTVIRARRAPHTSIIVMFLRAEIEEPKSQPRKMPTFHQIAAAFN